MENRQYKTKELFGRFLPYFKPYWKTMVFDLSCAGLTTLCVSSQMRESEMWRLFPCARSA